MRGRGAFLRYFARALASLLSAGVPLLPALQGLAARQEEGKWARGMVRRLARGVSEGSTLSTAMESEPELFSRLVVGLVIVGEQTGTLAETMGKIAEHLEESSKTRFKMYSSLTYPFILFGITLAGTVLLLRIFVPVFVPIFSGMGKTLPFPTRLLLCSSEILSSASFWISLPAAGFALFVLYRFRSKEESFRRMRDRWLLRFPLVGDIVKKGVLAQMTATLATAYSAGLSIAKALELVLSVIENEAFRIHLQNARLALAKGEKLSTHFLENSRDIFPVVGHMMAVAESTGETGRLMRKCSRMLEEEMDYAIERFSTFLEPGVLIVLGLVVGFVMTGVFLPLYQMLRIAG